MKQLSTGFTLIEMMIVVIIIGILASIGIPSYTQHLQNAAVTDARASLIGLTAAMERHRAQTGSYISTADNNGVPTIYTSQSPETGDAKFRLTIDLSQNPYTLRATAVANTSVWNGVGATPMLTLNAIGQWNTIPDVNDKDNKNLCVVIKIAEQDFCTLPVNNS